MLWNLPAAKGTETDEYQAKINSYMRRILESVLTVERVAQVDLVPERVAQLDADKLAVPGPLHVLFAVAVRV